MSSHSSILGGSTAQRRLACPASYLEEQRAPFGDLESEYAKEGTYLHEVISHLIKHKVSAANLRNWDMKKVGKYKLTDEQNEAVAVALDELERLKALYASPNGVPWKVIALEKLLPLPTVLGAFGSVDLVIANDVCVIILDWKFGQGVPVKALYALPDGTDTINPQAAFYACAARAQFKGKFKNRRIILAIVQPRIEPPSSHVETDDEELNAFVEAFRNAVIEALDRNAHRERGEHCRFATCKATCPLWVGPVFDLAVLDPARAALEASVNGPEMTEYGAYLSKAMDLAEVAETWAEEIRRQAHVFLEDGGFVRDWKLVPKRGSRQWIGTDADTIAALRGAGALDADIYTAPELRSVAQVEKALKPKKIPLPAELFHTVSSGTTIARADDARPESTHGSVINEVRQALRAL